MSQLNQPPYPADEEAICAALVKEIGRHNSWEDKTQAWQALLAVRMAAKSMREERDHLSGEKVNVSGKRVNDVTNIDYACYTASWYP